MNEEQKLHDATMEILRDVGIRVHNRDAEKIFADNGITVKDSVAFFTEEQVYRWLKTAPKNFTIHARNPNFDMEFGGGKIYPSPAYGCAFMTDRDGRQRPGTTRDYVNSVKLLQANDDFSINGGIIVQFEDAPDETSPADMFYSTLVHSDKVLFISTGHKHVMEAVMRVGCELFDGEKGMLEKPRMITLINTNSPLSLDGRMMDCLMAFARYGQPLIISPSTMLGTTGPITFAGTLAMGNAENLAAIALAQMVRPGTPIIYGMQSTALDMKNGQYACAAPEGTIVQGFGARMAKFYGLPSRGGGSLSDAPLANAQAGYESMMTFYSAYRHGINLITQAGSVLSGVKSTSYAKMLVDFEVIRLVKRSFDPVIVDADTLSLDDIKEIGHDGEFFTSEHTLEHCRENFDPRLGTRGGMDVAYFEENLDKEYARLMEVYDSRRPEPDKTMKDAAKGFFIKTLGMDKNRLDAIEDL